MNRVDILYDHYKESFAPVRDSISQRNRFFVLLFITMSLLFLLAVEPQSITEIILKIVSSAYGIDLSGQLALMQSALWVVLLYLTIRYFQSNIYIERQYKYIHKLESELSMLVGIEINREGTNYLSSYPMLNNIIDALYKWVFPTFYCAVVFVKMINEFSGELHFFPIIIDLIASVLCVVLTVMYMIFLYHANRED